jgi:hypothetical protein
MTWAELDRLVDADPIGLRDRAWAEIQELRTENQRLRADLVDGVDEVNASPAAQLIAALNVDTEQTYVDNGQLHAKVENMRAEVEHYDRLASQLLVKNDELNRQLERSQALSVERANRLAELRTENERLRGDLTDYALRVTMGGPTVPVDTAWANVTLPPPASASDETAPPIRTGRGSDRLSRPDPARRLTLEESQALTRQRHSGAIEKLGKS